MNQTELPNESKMKDGGRIFLKCSSCDNNLMEVWVQRPDEKIVTKIRAKCPYCKDMSFVCDIKGGFAYSGIAIDRDQGELDTVSTFITKIVSIEQDNDIFIFNIIKA